jgi:hypothetical protein
MTAGTFFIALIITALILVFIRLFWVYILIIGVVIYYVGALIIASLMSAIICDAFFHPDGDGWKLLWVYFILTYSGIAVVFTMITTDIIDEALGWLKSIFRK